MSIELLKRISPTFSQLRLYPIMFINRKVFPRRCFLFILSVFREKEECSIIGTPRLHVLILLIRHFCIFTVLQPLKPKLLII